MYTYCALCRSWRASAVPLVSMNKAGSSPVEYIYIIFEKKIPKILMQKLNSPAGVLN